MSSVNYHVVEANNVSRPKLRKEPRYIDVIPCDSDFRNVAIEVIELTKENLLPAVISWRLKNIRVDPPKKSKHKTDFSTETAIDRLELNLRIADIQYSFRHTDPISGLTQAAIARVKADHEQRILDRWREALLNRTQLAVK